MNSNDNSGTMFAGGAVLVIVVIGLCLKALHKIFIQLGKTFDAFGHMASSFFMMAWNVVLVLGLVTLGIGCVVGAVYFTYKYCKMVKRGTEIKEHVSRHLAAFRREIGADFSAHREQNESDLRDLEDAIEDIRKKQLAMMTPPAPKTAVPLPDDDKETGSADGGVEAMPSPTNVNNPF